MTLLRQSFSLTLMLSFQKAHTYAKHYALSICSECHEAIIDRQNRTARLDFTGCNIKKKKNSAGTKREKQKVSFEMLAKDLSFI